jgi:hypothetical protein
MASTSSQALVMMHRPVWRSTSIDRPMKPSVCWTAGRTLSRVIAMPSSMALGSPRKVVGGLQAGTPPRAGARPEASPSEPTVLGWSS